MTLVEFKRSRHADNPPRGCSPALAALWWCGRSRQKGDWDKAHEIVMDDEGADAAWVHAHLHRLEGDAGNAAYWYRHANKPVATAPLETEWEEIVAALLGDGA